MQAGAVIDSFTAGETLAPDAARQCLRQGRLGSWLHGDGGTTVAAGARSRPCKKHGLSDPEHRSDVT
jgi:hypothetical protein